MGLLPHHKIQIIARLVAIEEGKSWTEENFQDMAIPQKALFDVDGKVGLSALHRATQAALKELKR